MSKTAGVFDSLLICYLSSVIAQEVGEIHTKKDKVDRFFWCIRIYDGEQDTIFNFVKVGPGFQQPGTDHRTFVLEDLPRIELLYIDCIAPDDDEQK